jgi:hypothetical protein
LTLDLAGSVVVFVAANSIAGENTDVDLLPKNIGKTIGGFQKLEIRGRIDGNFILVSMLSLYRQSSYASRSFPLLRGTRRATPFVGCL